MSAAGTKLERAGRYPVEFTLNGEPAEGFAAPRMLLSDFLRHEIGATGTHVGCEHGVCGVCTVKVDGKAVRSCLMFAVQVEGAEIETIEGMAEEDGSFSALQQAFHENFALQCGYCTPGVLMSLSEFLKAITRSSRPPWMPPRRCARAHHRAGAGVLPSSLPVRHVSA
jgi:2-furoyl-CoA dehydrogenase 2Fe-2S iron sulfur subunit